MATKTLYLTSCDFSAWCNGGEDYATMSDYDRSMKGQFSGAGLNLTQYQITAIGIYGDYKRGTSLTTPLGNTKRGATLYNGSSISNMGTAISSQQDGNSKMDGDYAGFTNYYTTDTSIINQLINQINSGLCVTIDLHSDNRGSAFNYKFYGKNIRLVVTYEEKPKYTLTVSSNNTSYGTVSGGGTFYSGVSTTLTATAKTGCKFVKWSDGNTSATRTVTVTGNVTYTAYFEPIYIIYDSIFSFKRWANNNLTSWDLITISNVTDTGFTGTAKVDDAYTTECRPLIPVEAGKTYTFECTASGGGFEFFIFNCESSGAWSDFTYGNTQKFNFTPTKSYISIRCDVVGTGTVVNFSNFRIYPADCPYMSNSVSASERTDVSSWSMPTPTREGYTFKGWNTKPDGSGTTYTSSSTFPTADLVLYSQWEEAKPEIKSVQMIYLDKQISATNKVPCGEGFIISVELS